MHTDKRFGHDLFKTKVPYNCLTLLDVRYGELYFDQVQKSKAQQDIMNDSIFSDLGSRSTENNEATNSESTTTSDDQEMSAFERRRAKLLKASVNSNSAQIVTSRSTNDQLLEEINKLLSFTQHVTVKTDVLKWCKEKSSLFPLISKYWLSYMAFSATSCNAERVFNIDGLILTNQRKSLNPETTQRLIVCHDYWISKEPAEMFQLCPKCPQPPNINACYQTCCDKHKQ